MLAYSLRRVAQIIPVVLGVVTLVFLMVRGLPGDPAAYILGDGASQEAIDNLRNEIGLNRPVFEQYLAYLGDIARMEFGLSVINKTPVLQLIEDALPTTMVLGGVSLLLGFTIAVPLGAFAAYYASRGWHVFDHIITGFALVFDVIPAFWLGLLLLLIFTLNLGWLPATGPVEWGDPVGVTKRLALPAAVLTVAQIGTIARVTRTSVLDVLADDYIRTARAMGTPEIVVLFNHALRNSALPIVTVAGLSFGRLLGGTVIVESVFALPGMGTLLVNSILGRDYPTVQAVVLIFATIVIAVNLLTDLTYTRVDPRVQI